MSPYFASHLISESLSSFGNRRFPFSSASLMTLFTLYFPALIWEVSRKIKNPKKENDYTTYSKLFGYKKATKFVMILTIVDIITND